MKFLLTATLPVDPANASVIDGSLPHKLQHILAEIKPEASYFTLRRGKRSCMLVVNITDASQIPALAEPFFLQLNAQITLEPIMTAEDLAKANLGAIAQKWNPKK